MKTKKWFEYEITRHPLKEFRDLAFFCSETGECKLEEVDRDQFRRLKEILNLRGKKGLELVQIFFGQDGAVAIWKRKIKKEGK
ncbi:MAG: hypothetical protein NT009_12945 [Proteobacteria bacterium]|nr:hypothetical protein [Pseudomonadota bacterium]